MAETFDRAAVEARLADAGRYALMDHETAQRFARAFHADLRATLAALDTATARVRVLEAQVRADHAMVTALYADGREMPECAWCSDYYTGDPVQSAWPCAVLTALALAPPPGEENG